MPQPISSEVALNVVKVLSLATTPLGAAAIARALPVGGRPTPKALQPLLAQLVADGHLLCTSDSPPRYITAPPEAWAQRAVLAALSKAPQSESKLKMALTRFFERLLPTALTALTETGKAYRHPARTKAGKPVYALRPADPAEFLANDLDKLIAAVAAKGFAANDVRRAAVRLLTGEPSAIRPDSASKGDTRPHDAGAQVLAGLYRLDPRSDLGASVPVALLREALRETLPVKGEFDSVLLMLAKRGVLELQSHAWPARLTEDERERLVDNGHGGWFDSVSLRRRRGAP